MIQQSLFLGIYPDKTINQRDTCTPMFIAVLFITNKTWKQPNCPLTDEWIKKMWYIMGFSYGKTQMNFLANQYTSIYTHTHTQRNTTQPQKRRK